MFAEHSSYVYSLFLLVVRFCIATYFLPAGGGIKLAVPKKKAVLSTPKVVATAPATKLKLDDDKIVDDGWDDF
jgi:hypothetical protein